MSIHGAPEYNEQIETGMLICDDAGFLAYCTNGAMEWVSLGV